MSRQGLDLGSNPSDPMLGCGGFRKGPGFFALEHGLAIVSTNLFVKLCLTGKTGVFWGEITSAARSSSSTHVRALCLSQP